MESPFVGEVIDLWAVPGATITAGAGTGLSMVLINGGAVGTATTALGTVGAGTADTNWVGTQVYAGSVLAGATFRGRRCAYPQVRRNRDLKHGVAECGLQCPLRHELSERRALA